MNDERTDHAAEAHEYEKEACGAQRIGEESAEAMATLSLMKATLALVEQQRIANLIALAQPVELPGGEEVSYRLYESEYSDSGDLTRYELRPEIREALGLRE